MKRTNYSIILKMIRDYGPISRAEVANKTGLTAASITNISQELIEKGFVVEIGSGQSSGGRPPILLKIRSNAKYIIGLAIRPGLLDVMISDLDLNILVVEREKVNHIDYERVFQQLESMLNKALDEVQLKQSEYIGIGVAMHGIVDPTKGISLFAPYYHWRNREIKSKLQDKFNLPVFVENDVNCMAIGEKWFGALKGRQVNSSITINIENGVGAGIILKNTIYQGANFIAGELGHVVINPEGETCNCGKKGCLETYISFDGIIRYVKNNLIHQPASILQKKYSVSGELTIDLIIESVLAGDELCLAALKRVGKYLGISLSHLIVTINPMVIVLEGKLNQVKDILFPEIKKSINETLLKDLNVDCELLSSQLGEYSSAKGAITLVLKKFFNSKNLLTFINSGSVAV